MKKIFNFIVHSLVIGHKMLLINARFYLSVYAVMKVVEKCLYRPKRIKVGHMYVNKQW